MRYKTSERRSLVGTITDKANASYTKKPIVWTSDKSKREWFEHWIKTAEAWRDELAKEGLTKTVDKLNRVITLTYGDLARMK